MQNQSLPNYSITLFKTSSLKRLLKQTATQCLSLLLLSIVSVTSIKAQVNTYSFSTSTGVALDAGPFTNLIPTFADDDVSAITNIGFTFTFGGNNYTTFSVTSNGLFAFGMSATTDYNNTISNLVDPILAPYWDDNYTDANGNVQYKMTGVAGSRKLVVDYNLSYLGNTGAADKHFQIWLYETSNKIMFVYGAGNDFNGGYSVAIVKNGITDFMSITTATNTSSIVTQQDNNTTWPGAGRAYTINGVVLPVSITNFSGYKDGSKNQLQWTTVSENNNLGFEIQRSADGVNYTTIGFVNSQAAGGNSVRVLNYNYTDNNPAGSRQYYRFKQVDINAHTTFSNVIRIDGEKPLVIKADGVFPNPASTIVNIQVNAPAKTKLTVLLVDNAGKTAMQQDINAEAGRNIIPVDISKLSNATYTLKLSSATGYAASFKVMVIK
jgi:hypothetical protein